MSTSTNGPPRGFGDRFRVESRLGRGGMGDVYKAHDAMLDRTVAVKTVTPGNTSGQAVERLLREARACARLSHPGIVVIHDVLQVEESVHIVMEHLQGASLESLPRFPRFSTFEGKVGILVRILDALHYAHGRGVVHRDVKLSNVQLLPDGSVKLLDFGIAHLAGAAALTASGMLTGTPHYASPEQLRGEESDASTDIYSTGILAFELLTRRRPFEGDSVARVLTKVLNDPLPPMGTSLSEAFPEVERIVRRAAAKRRQDRYAGAEDMKNALAAFVASSREAIAAKQAEVAAMTARLVIEAKSLMASNRTAEAVPLLTSVLRSNPDAEEARSLLHTGDGAAGAAGGGSDVPTDAESTVLAGPNRSATDAGPAGETATASYPGAGLSAKPRSAEAPTAGPAGAAGFPAPQASAMDREKGTGPGPSGAPSQAPAGAGRRVRVAAAPALALAVGVVLPGLWWLSVGGRDAAPAASAVSSPREPESVAAVPRAVDGLVPSPRESGSPAGDADAPAVPSAGSTVRAAVDAVRGRHEGEREAVPTPNRSPAAESSPASGRDAAAGGLAAPDDAAGAAPDINAEASPTEARAPGASPAPAESGTLADAPGAKEMYYAATMIGPLAPVAANRADSAPPAADGSANAGIKYRILRREADGGARAVDPATLFRSGDRIRFAFEPNVDGFLYVIQRGSTGRWSVLLPHPLIDGGSNAVRGFGEVTIPPEGWFRFDENPGTEQVFVYLSREPLTALPWGGGPVAVAQSVEEPTVIELANSVKARDLVFEKEDAPEGAGAAAWVVNQGEVGSAVAWTVELRHR